MQRVGLYKQGEDYVLEAITRDDGGAVVVRQKPFACSFVNMRFNLGGIQDPGSVRLPGHRSALGGGLPICCKLSHRHGFDTLGVEPQSFRHNHLELFSTVRLI